MVASSEKPAFEVLYNECLFFVLDLHRTGRLHLE